MLTPIHEPTVEFTTALFEHYAQEPKQRLPIVIGSYLPALDIAKNETKERWLQYFGVEVPESIAYQNYVLPPDEADKLKELKEAILGANLENRTLNTFKPSGYGEESVGQRAAHIRKRTYHDLFRYGEIRLPHLQFEEPLLSGYPLQSTEHRQGGNRPGSVGCAITVFGMNAMRLIQTEGSPGAEFDSLSAAKVVEEYADRESRFDLAWLLGSLGTRFAAEQSGHEVRNVVTIGADFGEIERKVIEPLQAKVPDLQFMLNVVLASETNFRANHTVNVMSDTPDLAVRVLDPNYLGYRDVDMDEFWDRWVLTNMQAVVTVVK